MTIVDFLRARLDEDEATARQAQRHYQHVLGISHYFPANHDTSVAMTPRAALREVRAKRAIVDLHDRWPVLVKSEPKLEPGHVDDISKATMRMTQQIAWATQEQYRATFGEEPPTAPMIRVLAAIYEDHPDYLEEWRPADG